jgi:hypothetical protein
MDGSNFTQLMGDSALTGPVTIHWLSKGDVPPSFQDPFTGQEVLAQGEFVGYRYTVTNGTNAEFQPATQINGHLRLTTGNQSWPTADYEGSHQQDVSSSYAETVGDEQTATMVGAGFEQTTWAVFDVPVGTSPLRSPS